MLKLKLQYIGHLMQRADSLEKFLMLRKSEGQRRRGEPGLSGHESEQTPENSERQGSLKCCCPWCCKELDTTQQQQPDHSRLVKLTDYLLRSL